MSGASRGRSLVLLRLSGEVSTKADATRRRFVDRLQTNAHDALVSEGIGHRIRVTRNRLLAEVDGAEAIPVLARLFGVQSVSAVEPRPAESVEQVVQAGVELFADRVAGHRFAVRARRVGDRHEAPLRPAEIEKQLGAALRPRSAGVDLEDPEVTVRVELFGGRAHFFTEAVPGPGGLPLGTEGRAVALCSGGFDSAVAAWRMLRRGVAEDFVFCNLGGVSHRLGALRVMVELARRWCYGTRPRLHAIEFGPVGEEICRATERRFWQVHLKRMMLRAAETVARESGALAIVTGESVGQVSSQTLRNLAVIRQATELPVLQPLAGSNKDEILAEARAIGTFDLSAAVGEYCGLVPRRPATTSRLDAILRQEERIDPAVLRTALEAREVLDLRSLEPEAIGIPELEVQEIPPEATVLDLRDLRAYRSWHWPGALHLEFGQALRAWPSFDRSQRYVLYCEFGLKSAHLAELMREAGFRVHHYARGIHSLRELAARAGTRAGGEPVGSRSGAEPPG